MSSNVIDAAFSYLWEDRERRGQRRLQRRVYDRELKQQQQPGIARSESGRLQA